MAFSTEAVARARQRLAAAKADRESAYLGHLSAAYASRPRLQEIDRNLRQTMARAAQAAFAQGKDAQAVMEQVKQDNLALQQERQAILRRDFPELLTLEQPICPACGGAGYVGSTMCRCLRELCCQEQERLLGQIGRGDERFDAFRLDYYPDQPDPRFHASPRAIMERNLRKCREYAAGFSTESGNLLFNGGTGLGKTYLAVCIAREVSQWGFDVAYETAIDLFSKLERARFSPGESDRAAAQRLYDAELLIVDDLGTELPGQFVTSALYGLLNDRLVRRRPMVITTNLNVEETGRRYSPQIASRLFGDFFRMTFVGNDIRERKDRMPR